MDTEAVKAAFKQHLVDAAAARQADDAACEQFVDDCRNKFRPVWEAAEAFHDALHEAGINGAVAATIEVPDPGEVFTTGNVIVEHEGDTLDVPFSISPQAIKFEEDDLEGSEGFYGPDDAPAVIDLLSRRIARFIRYEGA